MPLELWADNATAQVTAGFAQNPAAGTIETWTVVPSAQAFPAALNTGAAMSQFQVGDPAAPLEEILVVNVTGTNPQTWTVVRGYKGTVQPHLAGGFTVRQVITSGWLSQAGQQLATQRSLALTPWTAGVANRQSARCNVVCIGDSITEGQGAAGPPSNGFELKWVSRLRDMLRAQYPTPGLQGGGRGYIGCVGTGEVSFTWPVVAAGTPTLASGAGVKAENIAFGATGQSFTFTLTGDSADIMWIGAPAGGTFSWAVDGGAATNISTAFSPVTDGKITHISLGPPGQHTLVLAWVSGIGLVDGVVEYYGDFASGIQVHDGGHYGWQTSDWVTAVNAGAVGNCGAAIAAVSPSLIIIMLGVNDQSNAVTPATYQANLQTIITGLKVQLAAPLPSFVLAMLPPRTNQAGMTYSWDQYVRAAWNVAAADTSGPASSSLVTVCDFTMGPRLPGADADIYGIWKAADLVHPSNKGHQAIADQLCRFLTVG